MKDDFLTFLSRPSAKGKVVAAYGAAAKGNTLLNFAGVRPDLLAFVVDRNPAKQGKYMPGSRIPIVAEERWPRASRTTSSSCRGTCATELVEQLTRARDWGGQFVVAVPELDVF